VLTSVLLPGQTGTTGELHGVELVGEHICPIVHVAVVPHAHTTLVAMLDAQVGV